MSLSTEIQRLADLRASGAITDEEFQLAKQKLLNEKTSTSADQPYRRARNEDQSLGRAANRYVTFQAIFTLVTLFVIIFIIGPKMCSRSSPFGGTPGIFSR